MDFGDSNNQQPWEQQLQNPTDLDTSAAFATAGTAPATAQQQMTSPRQMPFAMFHPSPSSSSPSSAIAPLSSDRAQQPQRTTQHQRHFSDTPAMAFHPADQQQSGQSSLLQGQQQGSSIPGDPFGNLLNSPGELPQINIQHNGNGTAAPPSAFLPSPAPVIIPSGGAGEHSASGMALALGNLLGASSGGFRQRAMSDASIHTETGAVPSSSASSHHHSQSEHLLSPTGRTGSISSSYGHMHDRVDSGFWNRSPSQQHERELEQYNRRSSSFASSSGGGPIHRSVSAGDILGSSHDPGHIDDAEDPINTLLRASADEQRMSDQLHGSASGETAMAAAEPPSAGGSNKGSSSATSQGQGLQMNVSPPSTAADTPLSAAARGKPSLSLFTDDSTLAGGWSSGSTQTAVGRGPVGSLSTASSSARPELTFSADPSTSHTASETSLLERAHELVQEAGLHPESAVERYGGAVKRSGGYFDYRGRGSSPHSASSDSRQPSPFATSPYGDEYPSMVIPHQHHGYHPSPPQPNHPQRQLPQHHGRHLSGGQYGQYLGAGPSPIAHQQPLPRQASPSGSSSTYHNSPYQTPSQDYRQPFSHSRSPSDGSAYGYPSPYSAGPGPSHNAFNQFSGAQQLPQPPRAPPRQQPDFLLPTMSSFGLMETSGADGAVAPEDSLDTWARLPSRPESETEVQALLK